MCSMSKAPAARLSVISARRPEICTKVFSLNERGEVKKETHADVYEGNVVQITADSLQALAEILRGLKPNQATCYGLAPAVKLDLVTDAKWAKNGRPVTQVARTGQAFSWPSGAGVLMLDYDPPKDQKPLERGELVELVRRACPGLADAAMLWWPSASSQIFNAETGEQLHGVKGQRLYLLVKHGTDIPRAGAALISHLWRCGEGYFWVSASGAMLERSLFDASVWQSNRLDFSAGAVCAAPLEQRRGDPVIIEGGVEIVETSKAIPDLTPDQADEVKAAKARARVTVEHEARIVRERFKADRADHLTRQIVAREGLQHEAAATRAREVVGRAVEGLNLLADWPLTVKASSGEIVETTVGSVLDAPYRWHGCKTLDPIEPDYDGGRWVGKLYLIGARPVLHSKARGEATFKLSRQVDRVEVVAGKFADTVDALVEVLQRAPDVFDYGDSVVEVGAGGALLNLNKDSARYTFSRSAQFFRRRRSSSGEPVEVLVDPPMDICTSLLARGSLRGLRQLEAVVTAPIMRADGTVITTGGYDVATKLLVDLTETPPGVPDAPTAEQLAKAWRDLWQPFQDFPIVSADDRAVLVAALLTAIQRPLLPSAPAIAFDAPRQGTGKSFLAECVSIIATGQMPNSWPHVDRGNDEEIRKRIMTALRSGQRIILWDNVMGQFDSAAIATLLTSSVYSDRKLTTMDSASFPNKSLMLVTGNNFVAGGELQRRVLKCRLDAQTESPFTRSFDFDPRSVCKARRQEMIAAGLTLLRGYVAAGRQRVGEGSLGSFEDWDRQIRQAVIWVGKTVEGSSLGDPIAGVTVEADMSPADEEHAGLMFAWLDVFGGNEVSAEDLLDLHQRVRGGSLTFTPDQRAIADALDSLKGRGAITKRAIGDILRWRKDRVVAGLVIKKGRSTKRQTFWHVVGR